MRWIIDDGTCRHYTLDDNRKKSDNCEVVAMGRKLDKEMADQIVGRFNRLTRDHFRQAFHPSAPSYEAGEARAARASKAARDLLETILAELEHGEWRPIKRDGDR